MIIGIALVGEASPLRAAADADEDEDEGKEDIGEDIGEDNAVDVVLAGENREDEADEEEEEVLGDADMGTGGCIMSG
jgi:hypothetical protein